MSLGCLPFGCPFARATLMPSRVHMRIRSASNSATIANTLNSSRPTGSFGSWIDPLRLNRTFLAVNSVRMSRASGSDRASRSSLVTAGGVAGSAGGQGESQPGPVAVGAGQAVVDIDAVITDAEPAKRLSLCGEILLFC